MSATDSSRTILITGGSRGIGRAVADLAIDAGYRVCITYQQAADAAASVVARAEAAGLQAVAIQCDVSDTTAIDQLFERFDSELGQLDVLVNNAGIVAPAKRVDEFDVERVERLLSTNITGSIWSARHAVQRMSSRHGGAGGSIINISSVAAQLGGPNEYVDYAATKGAIDSFTVGLAKEVATEGVRVNAVRPGLIHTDIHASGGEADRVNRLQHLVPMQRGGTATEVAKAVIWLASDDASYVTGSLLNVSGGR